MAVEVFKLFGSIFVDNDAANKSISATDDKAKKTHGTLAGGVKTAAKWGAAILGGATAAAGGVIKMAKNTADTANEIDKMSQRLGISKEAYQEWDYVLSQADVDINSMQVGMKTMTNQIGEAKKGSTDALERFSKLGISLKDLQSMSREDIFNAVITGFQGMEDSTERAALANKMFGKSGQNLIPLFNTSAKATDDLKNKAHELGIVMSDETVSAGADLIDTMDTMKRTGSGILNSLGGALMPIINKFFNAVIKYMPQIRGFINKLTPLLITLFNIVMPVLTELGGQLIPTIMTLLQSLLPVFMQLFQALAPIITQLLVQILPPLIQIIEQIIPPLIEIISAIIPIIQMIFSVLSPLIDLIFNLTNGILGALLQAITPLLLVLANTINTILKPLIPIFERISALLSETLGPVFQTLGNILTKVFKALEPVFNLLGGLLSAILPALTPVIEALAKVLENGLGNAFKVLGELVDSIIQVFGGLIDFITGIFTGNWEKAWNGIVNVFKGIFNIIPTVIEGVINGAIGLINLLIDGINSITGAIGIPEISHIPDVNLPRLRAGLDDVPHDKYPVYLDAGEAVLKAQEAEEYRKSKREAKNPFESNKDTTVINNEFSFTVNANNISSDYDIKTIADKLSDYYSKMVIHQQEAFG